MSLPRLPQAAKLVIGLFMNQRELIHPITDRLKKCFGAIDMVSPWFDFSFTDYYESEMGTPLYRRMLVFVTLIQQSHLANIKKQTNAIENLYAQKKITIFAFFKVLIFVSYFGK